MVDPELVPLYYEGYLKSLHSQTSSYLEDHPRTCKWLVTMVIVSPLNGVVGPLINGRFMAYKWWRS